MNDDKLTEIFRNYNPELPSDEGFMSQFHKNMDSIELVKQQMDTSRRSSRRALIAASVAGFAAGVLFSLAVPVLADIAKSVCLWIFGLSLTLADSQYMLMAWVIVGAAGVLSALGVYNAVASMNCRIAASREKI